MKKHDDRTNSLLARVVERYQVYRKMKTAGCTELVRDTAAAMSGIAVLEMYMLTQD